MTTKTDSTTPEEREGMLAYLDRHLREHAPHRAELLERWASPEHAAREAAAKARFDPAPVVEPWDGEEPLRGYVLSRDGDPPGTIVYAPPETPEEELGRRAGWTGAFRVLDAGRAPPGSVETKVPA